MTTERLRRFARIAEKSGYSVTARKCNISQSSVSKRIRTLEWELGCTLFDRSRHHVKFAKIGARVYPLLKNMLAQFDDMLQETHGYMRGDAIKLASLPSWGNTVLPKRCGFLRRLKKNADTKIEQEEHDILKRSTMKITV